MMKKKFKTTNEKGTLLVEAMAMLGLIAMVTPVLYKKAAERTVELQDINASSQLRSLSSAVDSYLRDNFAKITKGEEVDGVDYSSFANATDGIIGPLSLATFKDYLPYGFLDGENSRETKLFTNAYNVWIKMEADIDNGKALSQVLTGFISATPKNANEISSVRASRIASMVGSNGGYVTDDTVMGAQGIWSISKDTLDASLSDNTFVISSLQPISSQGLANEDVLHRKDEPDADQELNTMETDLFMGFTKEDTRNIRLVNQIIMYPNTERMVGGTDAISHNEGDGINPLDGSDANELGKALYIGNGGGAYIEGTLKAMNSLFQVDGDGIAYYAMDSNTNEETGDTVTTRKANPTLKIDGSALTYGDPGAASENPVKFVINQSNGGSLNFGKAGVAGADGSTTTPESEYLFANGSNFRAAEKSISSTKDSNGWNTVITGGGNADTSAHSGARTRYTWTDDVPDDGADVASSPYEVTVNGSAFVRDTLLTGKVKTFNIDTATLRAGIEPSELNESTTDGQFYTVAKENKFVAGKGRVMFSVSDSSDNYTAYDNGYNHIPAGVSIRSGDSDHGFDVALGDTVLFDYDGKVNPLAEDYSTQSGVIRMSAERGVYIGAFDNDGAVTGAPVSIQGDIFRAYSENSRLRGGVIDSAVDNFNIFSTYYNAIQNEYDSSNNAQFTNFRRFEETATGGIVRIIDNELSLSNTDNTVLFSVVPQKANDEGFTVKLAKGFAVYDDVLDDTVAGSTDGGVSDDGGIAAFLVKKGLLEVRATKTNSDRNITTRNKILVVDNNQDETVIADEATAKGSVYIRKGSINLAPPSDSKYVRLTNDTINKQYDSVANATGYIAAERFISHYNVPASALNATNDGTDNLSNQGHVTYDKFEVNPAYTSVMHDIKLTTRGGARLSDILPDFINKGIYVIDTTYVPETEWYGASNVPKDEVGESAENEVSPYAGFVPTPKCPPQYAKVVTITPSGWAMAQAGTPVTIGKTVDIAMHTNPYEFLNTTDPEVNPLTYQKNTWLKEMVLPYCGGSFQTSCSNTNTFKGWGAIMGFIFPTEYYRDFINGMDKDVKETRTVQGQVYWNLFPVYYKQIEGYATVYCYFDRTGSGYNEDYVDTTYNQLGTLEAEGVGSDNFNSYNKSNTQYINRLNDPNLKYKDPW